MKAWFKQRRCTTSAVYFPQPRPEQLTVGEEKTRMQRAVKQDGTLPWMHHIQSLALRNNKI